MRKLIFGGAISFDNYIAGPDESVDWIRPSDEAMAIMSSLWKRIDTILWGRKTYEFALRNGQKSGYPGKTNFVFSRTLSSVEGSFTLVSNEVVAFIQRLKDQSGQDIFLMGGGELAHSCFAAGLIDELGFNIHPVLLGSGIPLFRPMPHQTNLELIECKPFKNGCVYIAYQVVHL